MIRTRRLSKTKKLLLGWEISRDHPKCCGYSMWHHCRPHYACVMQGGAVMQGVGLGRLQVRASCAGPIA